MKTPKQYSTTPRHPDYREALDAMEEIISDFFAFQAAACTAQPGCNCGRKDDHPMHQARA